MKSICVLLLIVGAVYCENSLISLDKLNDLSSFPGPDLQSIETIVSDKCKQHGGKNAYKSLKDSAIELQKYFEKNFQPETITKEIEDASKTGSLDEVFKKYCDLKPDVMQLAHKVGSSIENCLEDKEKSIFKLAENITEGLIDFACDKDGERIALFLVEDGFSCISSKVDKLQKCADGVEIPTEFDKVPDLTVSKEKCNNYKKTQECVVTVLEECSNGTPSNVIDSLLSYIYKLSPCSTLK